jgi:cytosine/adenosine deaminase-related metal-dependent hydrolase
LQAGANCKNRRPTSVSFAVVAHAPYSVSPALLSEIARRRREAPLAIHLGESLEEVEFLRTGGGPIRDTLQMLGIWPDTWTAPHCDPLEYIHRLGYLQPGLLAVHAVHLTDDALARLRRAQAVVVTCPRSNTWVGAGVPRLSHFYATGVAVAVGTDSLASSPTLNLFDELHEMRRLAPDVTAAALLHSATRQGAVALGFGAEYGSIEAGRRAELLAVDIPSGVTDVEEYLVSGVPSGDIRWAPS